VFAESQGVPFTTADGVPLRPATMHYWFIATSTFVLAVTGAWVTRRFIEPKLDALPFEVPEDIDVWRVRVHAQRSARA
jgi:aminobenzoyl-glutamate transport protein